MYIGIDVSNHQGSINWQRVKDNGIEFAIIRSSWGWFTEDTMFRQNVNGCETVGLPYGLYHYSYARNIAEAEIEVAGLINLANSCNPSYPIIIDMEDADGWKARNGNPSNQTLVDILAYQCDRLEKAGYYAMIYANKDWFTNRINSEKLNKYDKWLAHINIPQPSMNCGIWQYSFTGRVNGINGDVDMNYAYNDYPSIIKGMKTKPNKTDVKPTPVQQYGTYTVVAGDTLSKIANQYNTTAYELKGLNPIIKDINRIQIGWTLKVPTNSVQLSSSKIVKGDKVRVKNAIQYDGRPFATYFDTYDVIELNGDRAVIGRGKDVTCAINVSNLVKA